MAGIEEQVQVDVAAPEAAVPAARGVRRREPGDRRGHRPRSRTWAPSRSPSMARARPRRRSPAWEALGFEGRGRILLRMQKWLLDNAERVIETIVRSETGKTYEDAQLAEISYGADAFGFWAKNAEKYLADERVKLRRGAGQGQEADAALQAARAGRRHRAVELPADQLVRRLHPGAGRRQQRDPQAVRGHAADLAACWPRACASAACPTASSRSPPAWAPPARRSSTRST